MLMISLGGTRIQITGGFVRQDHRRRLCTAPRNRNPLLLSAGHLRWLMTYAVPIRPFSSAASASSRRSFFANATVNERQLYIFQRRQIRDQVKALKIKNQSPGF